MLIDSTASMFVRIRPLAEDGGHASRKSGEKNLKSDLKRLKTFNERMQDDSQEETYMKTGLPDMLDQFLSGYNATFLAYGQTGTGKTHTMFGSRLEKVAEYQEVLFQKIGAFSHSSK